ncbi:hypothetical protein V2J09_001185 [Rumex salicifolius]
MASSIQLLILSLFLFHILCFCASDESAKSYIVYMGGSLRNSNGEEDIKVAESAHLQFLSSVIPRQNSKGIALGHVYHHAFRGFSAMLTEEEASILSGHKEVISVFPDPKLQLHTTRSWDFLEEEAGIQSFQHYYQQPSSTSDDVIIGMIDTGILPESPSFSDKGIAEIPHRWKGVCVKGSDSHKKFCNRKIIGARYYKTQDDFFQPSNKTGSPRDLVGHGTHTASTAAGSKVVNASYFGLAKGKARGGSTTARIAVYKACSINGCDGSTILKAMEDAVKDGVDIISISLGMSLLLQTDFLTDPIAIGSFHAQQMGVMVVCSAGNDGPEPYTVVNTAPWVLTVAASNIDREFESNVVLGNEISFKGSAITLSSLTNSRKYPLAFAGDLAADFTPTSEASNCIPGSLDAKKIAGKIILCIDTYPSVSRKIKKLVVEDSGAKGLVYISEMQKSVPFDAGAFPFVQVGEDAGMQILKYINSSKNPTATILPTVTVPNSRPAPVVADFSSRGPGSVTENILKPDIMAPGVAILAAIAPDSESGEVPVEIKPSKFGLRSGTSMACPHVTGAAALIKSVHHDWTPSMIKSALMTTAIMTNNMGRNVTNTTKEFASPHEVGVGEISPVKALDPGLVFATTTEDYLHFLCNCGYSNKNIRIMAKTAFICPKGSSDDLISNINYPTISIGRLGSHQSKTVTRRVINVGSMNSTYTVDVQTPQGLTVNVSPKKIVFREGLKMALFDVTFSQAHQKGYKFGSLTWRDGRHKVRVVFAVNITCDSARYITYWTKA